MNNKKAIFSIVLLFVISNLLTTIWYMVSDDANYVSFRRSEPNYLGLVVNHLVFVIGFVYLFPSYIKEKNSRLNAFLYGVVVSAIMFVPTGLVVRSIWQVDFNMIFLLNTLVHLTIGGSLGLILLTIYSYKRKVDGSN